MTFENIRDDTGSIVTRLELKKQYSAAAVMGACGIAKASPLTKGAQKTCKPCDWQSGGNASRQVKPLPSPHPLTNQRGL